MKHFNRMHKEKDEYIWIYFDMYVYIFLSFFLCLDKDKGTKKEEEKKSNLVLLADKIFFIPFDVGREQKIIFGILC